MFVGDESDTGKYYPAKERRTVNGKRKQKEQCSTLLSNKWDAKINSQPESLASKVDEQLTEVI